MANRIKLTPKKIGEFLDALRDVPNVSRAARLIGLSRRYMYEIKEKDSGFSVEWDEAIQEGVEGMEEEAHRRAFKGTLKPVYQGGSKVGDIREYSDTLAIFLLKAHAPEKYTERYVHTGKDGGDIVINVEWPKIMQGGD